MTGHNLARTLLPTVAALALLLVLPLESVTRADEPQVTVGADQVTTVVGRFDSLAELLADICTKADVELRAYGAPDRAVTADYVERPLAQVIERLLSREDYLIGMRENVTQGGLSRVVWIRVTGAKHAAVGALPGGIPVPSGFGKSEFRSEQATDALRAEEAVAQHLLADDARVAAFLKVDPAELARSLRQYPHIEALLHKLRAEQQHPEVIEKLDAVIHELAVPDAGQ